MSAGERQATCAERIQAQQRGREADLTELYSVADGERLDCRRCDADGTIEWSAFTAAEREAFMRGSESEIPPAGNEQCDCPECGGSGEVPAQVTDEPDLSEDDARERIDEFALGATVSRVLRVDLSTGGPADYLTGEIDDDGELAGDVVYHFADWFDHAETVVDAGSTLERYFAEIASAYAIPRDFVPERYR